MELTQEQLLRMGQEIVKKRLPDQDALRPLNLLDVELSGLDVPEGNGVYCGALFCPNPPLAADAVDDEREDENGADEADDQALVDRRGTVAGGVVVKLRRVVAPSVGGGRTTHLLPLCSTEKTAG